MISVRLISISFVWGKYLSFTDSEIHSAGYNKMFAPHLKQLYRTCDKFVIRTLRNSRKLGDHLKNNPGLNKQIEAFNEDGFEVTEGNAEQFINESESDFYNVGGSFSEHMQETLMGKHEMRYHIVKEKYFKENMPNLLSWSEKEQIRHLASTQPDEWTPEKIAESFPVTVPIVKKILKYPWKPATEQRIARHDASVMRNWKELKEGTLKMPEDLKKHFLKFSDRIIPPLNRKSLKIDLTQEKKMGEFESIVQRCAANEALNDEKNNENNISYTNNPVNQSEKVSGDHKRMTLEELTTKIKTRIETGKDVDLPDQILYSTTKNNTHKINQEAMSKEIELFKNDDKENKVAEYKESKNDGNEVMNYPERIRIPKKAYKKGATYKVNDCFYDHDGKFLYRVLGMF